MLRLRDTRLLSAKESLERQTEPVVATYIGQQVGANSVSTAKGILYVQVEKGILRLGIVRSIQCEDQRLDGPIRVYTLFSRVGGFQIIGNAAGELADIAKLHHPGTQCKLTCNGNRQTQGVTQPFVVEFAEGILRRCPQEFVMTLSVSVFSACKESLRVSPTNSGFG
jgi:hypothetical protein